jgi:hypothetical protein
LSGVPLPCLKPAWPAALRFRSSAHLSSLLIINIEYNLDIAELTAIAILLETQLAKGEYLMKRASILWKGKYLVKRASKRKSETPSLFSHVRNKKVAAFMELPRVVDLFHTFESCTACRQNCHNMQRFWWIFCSKDISATVVTVERAWIPCCRIEGRGQQLSFKNVQQWNAGMATAAVEQSNHRQQPMHCMTG